MCLMRQLRRQKFVVLGAAADVSSFGFEIDESRDIYSPAAGFSRRTVVLLDDTGRICLAVKLIWQDRHMVVRNAEIILGCNAMDAAKPKYTVF